MYIREEMKLNKFEKVNIMRAKDLYMRGMRLKGNPPANLYSGEDILPPEANKTESFAMAEEWQELDRQRAEEEHTPPTEE